MTRLTIEIDDKLKARVKSKVYAEDGTMKQLIVELLKDYLKK